MRHEKYTEEMVWFGKINKHNQRIKAEEIWERKIEFVREILGGVKERETERGQKEIGQIRKNDNGKREKKDMNQIYVMPCESQKSSAPHFITLAPLFRTTIP